MGSGLFEPPEGTMRWNSLTGYHEMYLSGRGWVVVATPVPTTPAPKGPPKGPSGVSRPTGRKLPYGIDTIESMMPDMLDDQLNDLIDAALEELRIRERAKRGTTNDEED